MIDDFDTRIQCEEFYLEEEYGFDRDTEEGDRGRTRVPPDKSFSGGSTEEERRTEEAMPGCGV